MTARQMQALEKAVDKYGFAQEPWVRENKDGTYSVIDGEHRVELLRRKKARTARCRVFEGMADADVRILRQVANKLHGTHDTQKDADEFRRIFEAGRLDDLSAVLARDTEQFEAVLEKRFDLRFERQAPPVVVAAAAAAPVPAPPAETKEAKDAKTGPPPSAANGKGRKPAIETAGKTGKTTSAAKRAAPAQRPPLRNVRPGDVWQLGQHCLLCGDCTVRGDVESLIKRFGAHKGVSCIATDPPYGVGYAQNNINVHKDRMLRHVRGARDEVPPSSTIAADGASASVRPLLAAMLRTAPLLSTNTIYVFGLDTRLDEVLGAFLDAGATASQALVWVKQRPIINRRDYNSRHELAVYGWKGTHRFHGHPGSEDVLNYDAPARSTDHPTMKPVELMARLIKDGSRKGTIVYDPFAGSGSTLLACEQSGRRCMAIEIEPRYCAAIIRRYEELAGETAVVKRIGGAPGRSGRPRR